MTALVPCPSCQRHVRIDEAACPFCGSIDVLPAPPRARAVLGVSRAMLLAGATVLAACGKERAAPNDDGNVLPPPPPSAIATVYGIPPELLTAPPPEPLAPPDAGKADAGKGGMSKGGMSRTRR